MAEKRKFRFKIDAFTPDTMPMKRLAEYIDRLAALFGDESHVHLVGIESGSTSPVIMVDWEAEPKVADRIQKARNNEGPEETRGIVDRINVMLKKDNASAELFNPAQTKILMFPGARADALLEWPSINQPVTLYGVPVWVGGTGDAHVTLMDGTAETSCITDKETAIAIAPHIYTGMLRTTGNGRWRKAPGGAWALERYRIDRFEVVKSAAIDQVIAELRSVNAEWKSLADPVAALASLRSGE